MAGVVELLGETVFNGKREKVPVESLTGTGKAIGLYFSAHWCPSCVEFTPQLVEFYSNFKKTARADEMEIVFVSNDQTEESFNTYFNTMPWLALNDWKDQEIFDVITDKFDINEIPSLAIFDGETGELITTEGVNKVSSDPSGADWPWK